MNTPDKTNKINDFNVGTGGYEPPEDSQSVVETIIDEDLITIDIKIDNHTFYMKLNQALLTERTPSNDISETDLENQVDKMQYWRTSILSVAEKIRLKKHNVQLTFKLWFSEKSEQAQKILLEQKITSNKIDKISTTLLGQVTQKDVEYYIINNNKEYYEKIQTEIGKLEHDEDFLFKIFDVLEQRSFDLRMILQKRLKMYTGTY